jgi:hypothetical protein
MPNIEESSPEISPIKKKVDQIVPRTKEELEGLVKLA